MKTTAANASPTCQPWCWLHDGDESVCIGEAAVLEFPDAGPFFATVARVSLGYAPDEGVTVSVNVGSPDQPLRLDDADTVADLIKAKVAAARAGLDAGIDVTFPGPRTSTGGEVPA